MSYSRWGCDGSAVYVYRSQEGLVCCGCDLGSDLTVVVDTPAAMIAHLTDHRLAGDCVPEYVLTRLSQEATEAGR